MLLPYTTHPNHLHRIYNNFTKVREAKWYH
jgi:hypothetical protein